MNHDAHIIATRFYASMKAYNARQQHERERARGRAGITAFWRRNHEFWISLFRACATCPAEMI